MEQEGTRIIFDQSTETAQIAPGFRQGQFAKPDKKAGTEADRKLALQGLATDALTLAKELETDPG